jgi:glycosyltransferase involved in cell wall biosynthesis
MPGYLSRFVDSLATQCDEVICFQHQPRDSQREILDSRIAQGNVTLVPIGRHCAAWKRSLVSGRFVQPLRAYSNKLDVMLVRGPSPLLPAFAGAAQKLNIPSALLLVGSYVDGVDDLPQPYWRKELIRLYGRLNQWQQDRVAGHSLTFVNSRKLFDRYQLLIPHLVETRTTTLSENDFFLRPDTCQGESVRLLYTGRFERGKGLLEMVGAISILIEKGYPLHLDLVGWAEPGDQVINEVMMSAARLGISDRIVNHGRKAVGPDLFSFYKQADIYVIASRLSEGFPRTIWEAMAHSLPTVATRVGSIPQFLGDAAELVDPGSSETSANGIEALLKDPVRRQSMIEKGLALARENTLETRAREMCQALTRWIERG